MSKSQQIVIVDTGCANISSLRFAIERLGYSVTISKDAQVILAADKLFLPGVGTASEAMKNLEERGLIKLLKQVTQPVLGICLGMQLLGTCSEEGKEHIPCLGFCQGPVKLMDTKELPLPHMGWDTINYDAEHPLFKNISDQDYFYFVHSYAMPVDKSYTIASCNYGSDFTAAVQHNNYYGVQFHPERSSKPGAQLIKNFLKM